MSREGQMKKVARIIAGVQRDLPCEASHEHQPLDEEGIYFIDLIVSTPKQRWVVVEWWAREARIGISRMHKEPAEDAFSGPQEVFPGDDEAGAIQRVIALLNGAPAKCHAKCPECKQEKEPNVES